jgi:hypothetical protein
VASTLLLGGLAAKALRPKVPVSASLSLARKHWAASPTTRLLNSPLFSRDRELGIALLEADRRLPLERDAVLLVRPGTAPEVAELWRRKAAFVLAPRRVTLVERDLPPGQDFALNAASPPHR